MAAVPLILAAPLLAALCGAQDASPPSLTPGQIERVGVAVAQALASTGVPSASVSIVKDGRIAYVHAYGLAWTDPATPAAPTMRYEIGSISKQFTAAALLLLQQDGRLTLDDPVSKYLPSLTRSGEITIRMLLTHTSGYQDYVPEDYLPESMLGPTSAAQILDTWAKRPLDFDPGTEWEYSNTNYVIAARIIEIVTGAPYLKTIRDRILAPLRMDSAVDADTGLPMKADAHGYFRAALGPLRPAPKEGKGWMFGAYELAMTAEDLARWDISLIDRSLLRPESYDQFFTSAKLKDGSDTHYGLGVQTGPIYGQLAIEHTGEASGFVSDSVVVPTARVAVVVLTNQDGVNAASRIGAAILPVLLDSPPPAMPQEQSMAEARAQAIFVGLQGGTIDRAQLTPNLNAYFTPQTIEDFASSLKPLGPPLSFHQISESHRGGMILRVFQAAFPSRNLNIITYELPDGRLEQYMVIPAG